MASWIYPKYVRVGTLVRVADQPEEHDYVVLAELKRPRGDRTRYELINYVYISAWYIHRTHIGSFREPPPKKLGAAADDDFWIPDPHFEHSNAEQIRQQVEAIANREIPIELIPHHKSYPRLLDQRPGVARILPTPDEVYPSNNEPIDLTPCKPDKIRTVVHFRNDAWLSFSKQLPIDIPSDFIANLHHSCSHDEFLALALGPEIGDLAATLAREWPEYRFDFEVWVKAMDQGLLELVSWCPSVPEWTAAQWLDGSLLAKFGAVLYTEIRVTVDTSAAPTTLAAAQ